jgi:hypothetical protein
MGQRRETALESRLDLPSLYIGLAHYPVYNKAGKVICTAVTNLDIHDLARCAMTYGVLGAFIINPLDSQRELAKRLIRHWTNGRGARYNPARKRALNLVRVRATLEDVVQEISETHQAQVRTVATGAQRKKGTLSFGDMRDELARRPGPFFLVFGTGWGLAQEVFERSHFVLAPVEGIHDYNHLSVRSAAAIILDRLMGNR